MEEQVKSTKTTNDTTDRSVPLETLVSCSSETKKQKGISFAGQKALKYLLEASVLIGKYKAYSKLVEEDLDPNKLDDNVWALIDEPREHFLNDVGNN